MRFIAAILILALLTSSSLAASHEDNEFLSRTNYNCGKRAFSQEEIEHLRRIAKTPLPQTKDIEYFHTKRDIADAERILRCNVGHTEERSDEELAGRLRKECRSRIFTDEENEKLKGLMQIGKGASGLLATDAANCQAGYAGQITGKKRLEAAVSGFPECNEGLTLLETWSSYLKTNDPVVKANSLANAGDTEGACMTLSELKDRTENVRATLLNCYKHIPEDAAEDLKRLKAAMLQSAGQVNQMEASIVPGARQLECSGF